MNFDLAMQAGTVVINVTHVPPRKLAAVMDDVCSVFAKGYAMGRLAALLVPGERFGDLSVPEGHVGLATVCSITLNGVLLKYGVPTYSRFGGLLELRDGQPIRFVEIITYDGTSIDPLEVFIRSGMTDYHGAIRDGNGRIGASFREVPAESLEVVTELSGRLTDIGMGGIMCVGRPGQSVLGIPVAPGRCGVIMIGGLNPTAILEESGVRVESRALAGLIDFNRLAHFDALNAALQPHLQ